MILDMCAHELRVEEEDLLDLIQISSISPMCV